MKNTQIPNLLSPVPDDIRREVYTKALDYYEHPEQWATKYKEKDDNPTYPLGICLALPCILWELPDYSHYAPNDEMWDYHHAVIAFPEIYKTVNEVIMLFEYSDMPMELTHADATAIRIAGLKQILTQF